MAVDSLARSASQLVSSVLLVINGTSAQGGLRAYSTVASGKTGVRS